MIIPTKIFGIKYSLFYQEILIKILDHQVRKLRTMEVTSVKVHWRNQFVEEATSNTELDMKRRYPLLFESIDNVYQGTNSLPGTL